MELFLSCNTHSMDPDPFIRHTFWTLLIGGGTNMMTVYGAHQVNLQRYSSVKSLTQSKMWVTKIFLFWGEMQLLIHSNIHLQVNRDFEKCKFYFVNFMSYFWPTRALMLNLPLWCIYLSILSVLGLVMYAFFLDCDPLESEKISKSDQVG